jgi:hypothetical protein
MQLVLENAQGSTTQGTSHLWQHMKESCPFLMAVRQRLMGSAAA